MLLACSPEVWGSCLGASVVPRASGGHCNKDKSADPAGCSWVLVWLLALKAFAVLKARSARVLKTVFVRS